MNWKGEKEEMRNLVWCEFYKLKGARILWIAVLGAYVPVLLVFARTLIDSVGQQGEAVSLYGLFDGVLMFYLLLFGSIICALTAVALLVREYTLGTLKTVYVVLRSKKRILRGKFVMLFLVSELLAMSVWLGVLVSAVVCDLLIPSFTVQELHMSVWLAALPTVLLFLVRLLAGGACIFVGTLPFVWLAVRTRGYLVPAIAVTVMVLLNVVLSASPVAELYPWTMGYLLVNGRVGNSILCTLVLVVTGGGSAIRGFWEFVRQDIE